MYLYYLVTISALFSFEYHSIFPLINECNINVIYKLLTFRVLTCVPFIIYL